MSAGSQHAGHTIPSRILEGSYLRAHWARTPDWKHGARIMVTGFGAKVDALLEMLQSGPRRRDMEPIWMQMQGLTYPSQVHVGGCGRAFDNALICG